LEGARKKRSLSMPKVTTGLKPVFIQSD